MSAGFLEGYGTDPAFWIRKVPRHGADVGGRRDPAGVGTPLPESCQSLVESQHKSPNIYSLPDGFQPIHRHATADRLTAMNGAGEGGPSQPLSNDDFRRMLATPRPDSQPRQKQGGAKKKGRPHKGPSQKPVDDAEDAAAGPGYR